MLGPHRAGRDTGRSYFAGGTSDPAQVGAPLPRTLTAVSITSSILLAKSGLLPSHKLVLK